MKAIHTNARRFDRGAPNFQRMTPEERTLGRGGLYRFYDAEQRPLYFGISVSFEVRWDAHRLKAPWWPLAEFVALSFYSNKRTPLYCFETAAIRREWPAFNRKTQGANHRRLAPPLPRFPEDG
jgi:hypothetical protein